MKNRNEIPDRLKWDLSDIFASEQEWNDAYTKLEENVGGLAALRGTLATSAESLFHAYETMAQFEEVFDKVANYAFLRKATDGGDTTAQEMCERVTMLNVKVCTAVAFFEPELMAIPEEKLAEFLRDPLLAKYAHKIEDATRLRAHVLDEKSEAILAKFGKIASTPSDTYDMFTNVEMERPSVTGEDGEKIALSHGVFGMLRESENRRVREEAFEGMFGMYGKYINTFASLYGGSVKQDNLTAELRGYPSARAASLAESNVPEEVYDSLVEALHEAIPLMNKYLALRKRAMKLDSIDMFDLYTPMVENVEYPMPYETACELVYEAVKPLGEEYAAVIRRSYEERWIDVYETPGKESGAFSAGVYGVHPYVKLNYTDTLDDAFTLAHELGHAMHSYLSAEKQDFANHDYHLLVAEVASTCNEVLLTKYLLSIETDPRRRAYILNHFLEGFRTTVFRQTLFAEFEQRAHEMENDGIPLTSDALCDVYEGLVKLYYPDAGFCDVIRNEWAFIPHFYRAFYVYQYATGFSSAVAIADSILSSGDASSYIEFLSSGGSDYPIEELKIAGVDLTSPEVVKNAMKVFEDTIDELSALIEEI